LSLLPLLWNEAKLASDPEPAELLRLFVCRVLAAGVAELVELEAAGGRLLVLGGGVVPVLALGALQCDDFAHWMIPFVIVASHLGWQAAFNTEEERSGHARPL
jgi:hypothetical protein